MHVGGWQDSDRAALSKELLFYFQPGAFSGFRGLAKCESGDTEGTDVIRRTSSTFSLQEVGSESAILGVKVVAEKQKVGESRLAPYRIGSLGVCYLERTVVIRATSSTFST